MPMPRKKTINAPSKCTALPQAEGNQLTHLWRHQAAIGLQPHQFIGIGKSKWRALFDYAGL